MAIPLKFKTNVAVSRISEYVQALQLLGVKYSIRKAKRVGGVDFSNMASVWTLAEVDLATIHIELFRLRVYKFFFLKTIRTCRIVPNHPIFPDCCSLAATVASIPFNEVGDIWFVARNDFVHRCAPYFARIGKLGFLTWVRTNGDNSRES